MKGLGRHFLWSPGQKILTLYFAITYVIPLAGNLIFQGRIASPYLIRPPTLSSALLILLTYVGFMMIVNLESFQGWALPFSVPARLVTKIGGFYIRCRLAFALCTLILSFKFFVSELSGFRYARAGISEIGSTTLVLGMVLTLIVTSDLFYFTFMEREAAPLKSRRGLENVLLVLSLLLLIDGTMGAFLAFFYAFFALAPKFSRTLLFPAADSGWGRSLGLYIIAGGLFFLAWGYGESIKNKSKVESLLSSSQTPLGSGERPAFPGAFPAPVGLDGRPLVPADWFGPPAVHSTLWGLIEWDQERAQAQRRQLKERVGRMQQSFSELVARIRAFDPFDPTRGKAKPRPVLPKPPQPGIDWLAAARARTKGFSKALGSIRPWPFTQYVVDRMSVHYYSFALTTDAPREQLTYRGVPGPLLPFATMVFRLDCLAASTFGVLKPQVSTLSQLNYKRLTRKATSAREGTSPGVIASFQYLSPLPFSIILCVLYLAFLCRMLDRLVTPGLPQMHLVGLVLVMSAYQVLLDSPFDLLLVVDNASIKAGILLALAFARVPMRRSVAVEGPRPSLTSEGMVPQAT